MIGRAWQAYVRQDDGFYSSRLVLGREHMAGRIEVVCGDGTWRTFGSGEMLPNDAGIVLPTDALDAVAAAIKKVRGDTSHETEAKILREWLDSERGRVEDVLKGMRGQG